MLKTEWKNWAKYANKHKNFLNRLPKLKKTNYTIR